MATPQQQQQILTLVRRVITEYVIRGQEIAPPEEEWLKTPSGVFVTLTEYGELRGCIGFPEAVHPLGEGLVKAAIYAATEDPRFPALSATEVPLVKIEVSILSAPRRISDPSEVVVGEHGLILTLGYARGLLLPQVPVENGWDRDEFLRYIGRKAGVSEQAWKDPRAVLEVFTAEVFSEPSAPGA